MDHHPYIEKHLKGLKNSAKGERREANISKFLHQKFIPVLVSPLILREFGCGQIDICIYHHHDLFIFEIKSSPHLITKAQIMRLKKSSRFLEIVIGAKCYLRVIKSLPKDLKQLSLNI